MTTPRTADVELGGITDLNLIADVKQGFVDAFETITYVDRLRRVLKTLNGLRLSSRESSLTAAGFTDVVSRWRIVHSFRWSIIDPPDPTDPKGRARLMLSVNFDGGWEPYMRVIWDQLGSTLDLMLCHVEGYQLSNRCSFETYSAWVRKHEVSADFLFMESGRSVADAEYLKAYEASQRGKPDALTATRVHSLLQGETKPLPTDPRARMAMALKGLAGLSGLFALQRYFGQGAADGYCLLRATQDVFFEMCLMDTRKLFPAEPLSPVRAQYAQMLAWFEGEIPQQPSPQRELHFAGHDIQAGILSPVKAPSGALVLLRVAQPSTALAFLSSLPVPWEGGHTPENGLWTQVALSLSGLRALGVPETRLQRLPTAFKEGMAARAGLIGDVRHNHPRNWRWPRRVDNGAPIEPASAHVLVQLRCATPEAAANLQAAIAALSGVSTGLALMSVEPMRANPGKREHFGYVDGTSQPVAHASPGESNWSDQVPRGELLLGYPTLRDKQYPVPEKADALLDNGTILVVRKLRQWTGRLAAQVEREAARLGLDREVVYAKLMGRERDGKPLAATGHSHNDFNFRADADGRQCPIHSHIRRANPRQFSGDTGLANVMPRIMRRGMSYGAPATGPADADAERGLMFMAYGAHPAEQFEVIQRWLAGANSSGGYADQPDPLMAVVDPDARPNRLYTFEHEGVPYAMDLGPQPFVTLEWGGYFFVPSIPALRKLPALAELPLPVAAPGPAPISAPPLDDPAAWQLWLEDQNTRDAAWAWVRAQAGGVVRTAYGVLVGAPEGVCQVLRNSPDRYSVKGYGARMAHSVGPGYLGMDDDNGHLEQAPVINAAIEQIREDQAYAEAYAFATQWLARQRAAGQMLAAATGTPQTQLDLERLSLDVLASLCTAWFGQPDGQHLWGTEYHPPAEAPRPRCPADLLPVSRYVFSPKPSVRVEQAGQRSGQAYVKAVEQWLSTHKPPEGSLGRAIVDAAWAVEGATLYSVAATYAGIMLGFPPTVHANMLTVLGAWVAKNKLWEIQQQWLEAPAPRHYAHAVARLRPAMLLTLNQRPTPFQVYRLARADHRLGTVDIKAGDTVIAALGSATQSNPALHHVAFGGDRVDPQGAPPHACPGYGMGMGVMLGVAAALLEAGTLKPTGSPVSLYLDV